MQISFPGLSQPWRASRRRQRQPLVSIRFSADRPTGGNQPANGNGGGNGFFARHWLKVALISMGLGAFAGGGAGFVGGMRYEHYRSTLPEVIVDCHDGDTCDTSYGRTLRLSAVDTPEIRYQGVNNTQPFATEARDFMINRLQGRAVECDQQGEAIGGRPVCILKVDRRDINEEVLRRGLGYLDEDNLPRVPRGRRDLRPKIEEIISRYRAAQEEAQQKRLGVWSQRNGGERPADFRERVRRENAERRAREKRD